ncbi:AIR synthase-related protein [Erysipelothrix urinaevulpis]|uniref:AIR synthase-related protein n=1 Tax=Erysipelothrix urinaevulpis TaxID=2683717 RepID=UPI00135C5392|nr:AIR synthase-related protein [Erysipelothrix urinaevulpis]
MNTRLFIRRYSEFNSEEKTLRKNIITDLGLPTNFELKVYHCFDIYDAPKDEVERLKYYLNQNKALMVSMENPNNLLHLQAQTGQTDFVLDYFQRIGLGLGLTLNVDHSIAYQFVHDENYESIKGYLLNPNEMMESMPTLQNQKINVDLKSFDLRIMNKVELDALSHDSGLEIDDLLMVKTYCQQSNRSVNELELKFLSTYWSDHCRHTTFNTTLTDISFSGKYQTLLEQSFHEYLEIKRKVRPDHPITLMDLAQINARNLDRQGALDDVEKSQEVNAASIFVEIDNEEYLLMLKNETHNHPTELEPYGGASTCIGGCVRDPMSNRGTVYQGMRITGSKSPLTSYNDRRLEKLSSKVICQKSAQGFSDYANQMGLRTDYVKEYYHDGFEAKRLELGAVLASAPSSDVIKKEPRVGDLILVLGGRTGRDGIGAAVGSSSANREDDHHLKGPEVQKGNPIIERNLMRLFKDSEFTRCVKRSNDFGAGGLSVALGELSDGLDIHLDKMKLKYPLSPLEIALSESQERMAIVIDPDDKAKVYDLSHKLKVEIAEVGIVTNTQQFRMFYESDCVLQFDRQFLNENGAKREQKVHVETTEIQVQRDPVNKENQAGLRSMFANGNVRNDYLQESMTMAIPNKNGSDAVHSILSCGFNPWLGSTSPFHAGYESVIEAISKVVASGGSDENVRLSFQEFFPSPRQDEKRWGLVFSAMLGAFKAMNDLNIPAIGGKDSMSGSYEDLDVPPSIICFALQTKQKNMMIGHQLLKPDHYLILVKTPYTYENLLDVKQYQASNKVILELIEDQTIQSIATVNHSLSETIKTMGIHHNLTVAFHDEDEECIPVGSYLIELKNLDRVDELKGQVLGKTVVNEKARLKSALSTIYPYQEQEILTPITKPFTNTHIQTALIVVFDGFVEDMNLTMALKQRNIKADTFYFKDNPLNLARKMMDYDLVFIGDGFNELNPIFDGGEILELLFRNEHIQQAIHQLSDHNAYLITSGSSTRALIKANMFNKGYTIHSFDTFKYESRLIVVDSPNGKKHVRLNGHYNFIENIQEKYNYAKSHHAIDQGYRVIDFKHDRLNLYASLGMMQDENLDDILETITKEKKS